MALGILDLRVCQVIDSTLPQKALAEKFPTLFKRIGQLKNVKVKLHIDHTVNPVAQQPRRVPVPHSTESQ